MTQRRCLTPERYASAFAEFRKRTDQRRQCYEWLKQGLSRKEAVTRILSVGAGNGEFDLQIAPLFPNLKRYIALEPNPIHLLEFQDKVHTDLPHMSRTFVYEPTTLEVYSNPEQFDIVLLAQCLYYIPDRRGAVEKSLGCLTERGRCLILHQTEQGIYAVQKAFGVEQYHYCSSEIERLLRELGLDYRLHIVSSYIDLTNYPDELINFFLEAEASRDDVEKVRNYLSQYGDELYQPVAVFEVGAV